MRPFLFILLCLAAASVRAQPSASAPPLEPIPPPPLVSAPEEPPALPETQVAPTTPLPASPEVVSTPRRETSEASSLVPPPLPGSTRPALTPGERTQRYPEPGRYRSYSAGPGGFVLICTELVSGAAAGGVLGAAQARDGSVASGIMLGGLSFGGAAALYQYFARVESNEAWLTSIAAGAGFITGFGVASEQGLSQGNRALLTLASTQLSIVSTLAITAMQPGDVSGGDTWLVGTTSLYAFIFTGLVQGARGDSDITPTLAAPALGLIGGALLTRFLEPHPGQMFAITSIPIAAGLGMARLLERINQQSLYTVLLITMGSSFLITTAVTILTGTPEPPALSRASGFQAVPVPVLIPAGRGSGSVAAGPGLFMRF